MKNRTKPEFKKQDITLETNLKTKKGKKEATALDVSKVNQNVELLNSTNRQSKENKLFYKENMAS